MKVYDLEYLLMGFCDVAVLFAKSVVMLVLGHCGAVLHVIQMKDLNYLCWTHLQHFELLLELLQ